MRKCPQRVAIIIRVPEFDPQQADGIQRLRKLLKSLIRSYGLRAESIEPLPDTESTVKTEETNQ